MGKGSYIPSNVAKEEDEHPGAGSHYVRGRAHPSVAKAVQLVQDRDFTALLNGGLEQVHAVRSADELLHTGIADYTFIPGEEGILGKGKFSTVYKVKGVDGKFYALKHTPLYPHHPLIAARLLREPTLLAQIPPHPCLIGVQGWIKTPDHFYLVEDLSSEHVPLSDLPTPLENIGLIRKILDQLVSVVRDGLHRDGRVCHRDLKAENILINDHGDLVLLDLGLATRFSASAPKLTTCCGSPAFHSPEIVQCLNNPPGVYRYYGPELDIWCIGLTMLALLTGRRYPIGTSHTHLEVMAHSVKECLQEVDHIHKRLRGLQRSAAVSDIDRMQAQDDWDTVRDAVEEFLLIDGNTRILAFERYQLDDCIQKHVASHKVKMEKLRFKTISFETAPLKYTLPMVLQAPKDPSVSQGMDGLRLQNVRLAPTYKVHSYIKYLLRSSGILYHITYRDTNCILLQCVMTLPNDSPHIPKGLTGMAPALLSTIFWKRSSSVPPLSSAAKRSRSRTGVPTPDDSMKDRYCLRFWMRVCCECEATGSPKQGNEPLLSPSIGWMPPFFSELVGQPIRPPLSLRAVSQPFIEKATMLDATGSSPSTEAPSPPSPGIPKRYPGLSRQRSVSQRNTSILDLRAPVSSRWIDIRVSDGRCLETLVDAFQSSQTQGLLSPHSIIGELEIDDRDEAIQEANRVRQTTTNVSDENVDEAPGKPIRPEEHRLRGLNLKLSSSYEASNIPPASPVDSDDGERTPILHTPILRDVTESEEEERPARSKERKDFSHIVKTRAEHPEIHITPVNAFYYDRAHSASPARFSKAFPSIR